MNLTVHQRNQMYRELENEGLDPKKFSLESTAERVELQLRKTSSSFTVEDRVKSHGCYMVSAKIEGVQTSFYNEKRLEVALSGILEWARRSLENAEVVDLWSTTMGGFRETLGGVDEKDAGKDSARTKDDEHPHDNSRFSEKEVHYIRVKLIELQNNIIGLHKLTVSQSDLLKTDVEYLIDSSQRLGRYDWRATAIGILFTYCVEAALTSSGARDVMAGIGTLVQDAVGALPSFL